VKQIAALNGGVEVERVAGADRQGTSVEAMLEAKKHGASTSTIVVATGMSFADALAIGPYCYSAKVPILLVGSNKLLSAEQAAAAKGAGVNHIVVVGGNLAVDLPGVMGQLGLNPSDESAYDLVAGKDRYETAAKIVEFEVAHGMGFKHAAVATGANFPDALSGAALCGANDSVLVLASGATSPAVAYLDGKGSEVDTGYFLGGELAVSPELAKHVEEIAS
jgi:putative cell wall-binding protein